MKPSEAGSFALWLIVGLVIYIVGAALMGPSIGTTRTKVGNIMTEGGHVVSAIERYQHDHGRLPANLKVLVPAYLPELKNVAYARDIARNWPHKIFNHDLKSAWVYKVSHDKTKFALAVKDHTRTFYDSKPLSGNFMKKASPTTKKSTLHRFPPFHKHTPWAKPVQTKTNIPISPAGRTQW